MGVETAVEETTEVETTAVEATARQNGDNVAARASRELLAVRQGALVTQLALGTLSASRTSERFDCGISIEPSESS